MTVTTIYADYGKQAAQTTVCILHLHYVLYARTNQGEPGMLHTQTAVALVTVQGHEHILRELFKLRHDIEAIIAQLCHVETTHVVLAFHDTDLPGAVKAEFLGAQLILCVTSLSATRPLPIQPYAGQMIDRLVSDPRTQGLEDYSTAIYIPRTPPPYHTAFRQQNRHMVYYAVLYSMFVYYGHVITLVINHDIHH